MNGRAKTHPMPNDQLRKKLDEAITLDKSDFMKEAFSVRELSMSKPKRILVYFMEDPNAEAKVFSKFHIPIAFSFLILTRFSGEICQIFGNQMSSHESASHKESRVVDQTRKQGEKQADTQWALLGTSQTNIGD
jgi:hypothetical protein